MKEMRVIITGNHQGDAFPAVRKAMKAFEQQHGQITQVLSAEEGRGAAQQGRVWAGLCGVPVKNFAPRKSLGLHDAACARHYRDLDMLSEADALVYVGEDRSSSLLKAAREKGLTVFISA